MTLPRLYPILDTATLERRGCDPIAAARGMLDGGARILQFRHKGFFSRGVFQQAESVAELCRRAGAQLVVDDRADVAALLDAGVHLGQEDLSPADARRIVGPQRVIGFSTHNETQLGAARDEPVDYLAIGPVFGTGSKERPDPVLGLEALPRLRRLTAHPLVAIGGITLESAPAVLAAGIDSVAVIAGLLPETTTEETIRQRMEEWLKRLK
ncbi:MAG: thiamine phosphate synthase [Acidobacteria bacterium]|nr:thiamine phosphate synthase [Acidobacteriota bacterium]